MRALQTRSRKRYFRTAAEQQLEIELARYKTEREHRRKHRKSKPQQADSTISNTTTPEPPQ